MRKIVYYVAASLDGFIAGPAGDVSRFQYAGAGIDQYIEGLQAFDAVLMGHHTYAFGYDFGVQPGQPSPLYGHMEHFIVSETLAFAAPHPRVHVLRPDRTAVLALKNQPGRDIYLCGGGQLAGWLLAEQLIDEVKVKLNPLVLGQGTGLFTGVSTPFSLRLLTAETHPEGLLTLHYAVAYP